MRSAPVVLALGLAAAAVAAPRPQQQPAAAPAAQPPVFGVEVDVVAVDASVVDRDGRPVLGLAPAEFRVSVDGKPRRLLSVEYVGRAPEPPAPAAPAGPSPSPTHFSSNERAQRGRLILLLVDRGNIGQGGGRQVLKAADRFLGGLLPADRVGLAFVPGPGSSIEFTADLAAVRQALGKVVGTAERSGLQVPLAEAVAWVRDRDQLRWNQYVQLQCDAYKIAEQTESCMRRMEIEANQVYLGYRERSLASQRALAVVFATLARTPGPKTVVFVSEGLGTESETEVRALATAASQAQVTLYVVLLDTSSAADVSVERSLLARQEDREAEVGGLYSLAAQTRGAVLRAPIDGGGAFQRIALELTGYYLLGFEPEAGDRDGRSHQVEVTVARPGAVVRARRLLNIPAAPPSAEAQLVAALRSPLVDAGLPLQVTAYALPDLGAGKVRLLIAARVRGARRPLSVGFALSDDQGKVAASRAYHGIDGGSGEWVEFTGEALVEPSAYALRLAAVDAAGRRGSVEHAVKAAPLSAGGLELSDLVLAASAGGGPARPAVDLEVAGGGLTAMLELCSRDAARVAGARVALELADGAGGPALLRVPVSVGAARKDGSREASATIAAGLLPPGAYTARAEVSVDGKPVAALERPFRVVPAAAGAPPASLAGMLVEPPAFDGSGLLAAGALAHYVDRVGTLFPGPAPPALAAAIEHARNGRAPAVLDALGQTASADPRVAFLRGVSLYARDNPAAALTQLQSALRQSSELFAAAVYMGACYAAIGRDLDAIGAWQTALVDQSPSPALYAVLGDALMRVKEPQQAAETLAEGLAAFPEEPALRRRLALAHAAAGHRAEALERLASWLETRPDDGEALFVTMGLLIEGFAGERSAAAAERAQLERYAKAYLARSGPNRELIERWLRYLESRERG